MGERLPQNDFNLKIFRQKTQKVTFNHVATLGRAPIQITKKFQQTKLCNHSKLGNHRTATLIHQQNSSVSSGSVAKTFKTPVSFEGEVKLMQST